MNHSHTSFATKLTLLLLLLAAPFAQAQDKPSLKVVDTIWGFDGRVQPGQFNQLSILLDNQTSDPIDAVAALQNVPNMLSVSGGKLVQQVFIGATARRWIHFYPYIAETRQTEWRLTLGSDKIADITQPRAAWKMYSDKQDPSPQVIFLDRADRQSTQPVAVKHMPENIFPPYSTATFGLHTVFLDHVPDWETPRQESFMSWLRLGGRLQLLKNTQGQFPRFSGIMGDLNTPLDQFNIGTGTVRRQPIRRNEVTEDVVRRAIVVDTLKDPDKQLEQDVQQQLYDYQQGTGTVYETEPSSVDSRFFQKMRELTLPEHAWWLIFLLALCYIGLIFPGCFVLSKQKQFHFLATYGAIIGLSVFFSILFLFIGRRGYGETTNLQSMAIARAEGDSHWSVFEWNALFVTSGDDYTASAEEQELVIAADPSERSDAVGMPGSSGKLIMPIPPFSSQTFMSRRRIKTEPWKLQVEEFKRGLSGPVSLSLKVSGDFPASDIARYYVMSGRDIHEMRWDGQEKTLTLFGQHHSIGRFCQPQYMGFDAGRFSRTQVPEGTEEEAFFDESLRTLLQRCLLDDLVQMPSRFELPSDRIRVLVYTEVADAFRINVNADAKRTGRILLVKDVLLNATPAGLP